MDTCKSTNCKLKYLILKVLIRSSLVLQSGGNKVKILLINLIQVDADYANIQLCLIIFFAETEFSVSPENGPPAQVIQGFFPETEGSGSRKFQASSMVGRRSSRKVKLFQFSFSQTSRIWCFQIGHLHFCRKILGMRGSIRFPWNAGV